MQWKKLSLIGLIGFLLIVSTDAAGAGENDPTWSYSFDPSESTLTITVDTNNLWNDEFIIEGACFFQVDDDERKFELSVPISAGSTTEHNFTNGLGGAKEVIGTAMKWTISVNIPVGLTVEGYPRKGSSPPSVPKPEEQPDDVTGSS